MLSFNLMHLTFWFWSIGSSNALGHSPKVKFHGPITAEAGGMQNVHLKYHHPVDGELSLHYGECELQDQKDAHHSLGATYIGRHSLAKRHPNWVDNRPTKFVWLPPRDISSGGCLHAFASNELIGTSDPVVVVRRKMRRGKSFADVADPEGPWFDGVEYLRQKEPDEIFVAQAKSKSIGIIGGGMAGLMTAVRGPHCGVVLNILMHASIF
jgi:hypothetical protein